MMQAIKQSSLPKSKWYMICNTKSISSSMAFDRLRMSNSADIEVGIIDPVDSYNEQLSLGSDSVGLYIEGAITNFIQQKQPFYTGGGWTSSANEHDFSFDCSSFSYDNGSSDSSAIIVARNLKETSVTWQLYAYPTGYSATRNKNAELLYIMPESLHLGTAGLQIGRLRLTNQTLVGAFYFLNSFKINSKEVRLEGTSPNMIINGLHGLVNGGETNGTLSYDSVDSPVNNTAQGDYDTLISRGWSIVGGRPTS